MTQPSPAELQFEKILQALQVTLLPEHRKAKFSWKLSLRVGIPFYPQFMQSSLATHSLSDDIRRFKTHTKILQSNKQLRDWSSKCLQSLPSMDEWSLDNLEPQNCTIEIFDFPQLISVPERLRTIVSESV
jgi:hypothetical protein